MSSPAEEDVPFDVASDIVRVIRGEPDEVELAALVAGIYAAVASLGTDEPDVETRQPWNDLGRRLHATPAPGPSMWRWSLHP